MKYNSLREYFRVKASKNGNEVEIEGDHLTPDSAAEFARAILGDNYDVFDCDYDDCPTEMPPAEIEIDAFDNDLWDKEECEDDDEECSIEDRPKMDMINGKLVPAKNPESSEIDVDDEVEDDEEDIDLSDEEFLEEAVNGIRKNADFWTLAAKEKEIEDFINTWDSTIEQQAQMVEPLIPLAKNILAVIEKGDQKAVYIKSPVPSISDYEVSLQIPTKYSGVSRRSIRNYPLTNQASYGINSVIDKAARVDFYISGDLPMSYTDNKGNKSTELYPQVFSVNLATALDSELENWQFSEELTNLINQYRDSIKALLSNEQFVRSYKTEQAFNNSTSYESIKYNGSKKDLFRQLQEVRELMVPAEEKIAKRIRDIKALSSSEILYKFMGWLLGDEQHRGHLSFISAALPDTPKIVDATCKRLSIDEPVLRNFETKADKQRQIVNLVPKKAYLKDDGKDNTQRFLSLAINFQGVKTNDPILAQLPTILPAKDDGTNGQSKIGRNKISNNRLVLTLMESYGFNLGAIEDQDIEKIIHLISVEPGGYDAFIEGVNSLPLNNFIDGVDEDSFLDFEDISDDEFVEAFGNKVASRKVNK